MGTWPVLEPTPSHQGRNCTFCYHQLECNEEVVMLTLGRYLEHIIKTSQLRWFKYQATKTTTKVHSEQTNSILHQHHHQDPDPQSQWADRSEPFWSTRTSSVVSFVIPGMRLISTLMPYLGQDCYKVWTAVLLWLSHVLPCDSSCWWPDMKIFIQLVSNQSESPHLLVHSPFLPVTGSLQRSGQLLQRTGAYFNQLTQQRPTDLWKHEPMIYFWRKWSIWHETWDDPELRWCSPRYQEAGSRNFKQSDISLSCRLTIWLPVYVTLQSYLW